MDVWTTALLDFRFLYDVRGPTRGLRSVEPGYSTVYCTAVVLVVPYSYACTDHTSRSLLLCILQCGFTFHWVAMSSHAWRVSHTRHPCTGSCKKRRLCSDFDLDAKLCPSHRQRGLCPKLCWHNPPEPRTVRCRGEVSSVFGAEAKFHVCSVLRLSFACVRCWG